MSRKNALDQALDQPGYPRMEAHEFDLPEAGEWFGLCGVLTKRRIAEGETLDSVCKDISLDPYIAQGILNLISEMNISKLAKHFVGAAGGPIPPLPVRDEVWLDAIEVGRAIYKLAQHKIYEVRHALSVFAAAASLDRQIAITVGSERHLHFARFLICFVEQLAIDGLGIGLVAYTKKEGMHADLDDLCDRLGLDPKKTPTRTEKARNAQADSPMRQAGLEVLRVARARSVTDQAFFSAMIMGAVVQVWRFTLPAAATPATETSEQQSSNSPESADPTQKLQPASEHPSIDRGALRELIHRGGPG